MRYIQKIGTPFEPQGKAITQAYLNRRWQHDHYVSFHYKRVDLRGMDALLVQEQQDATGQSYCSYCMRRLFLQRCAGHEANVTLEHIVPNHIDTNTQRADIVQYQRYPCLDNNHLTICHKGELPSEKTSTQITEVPYPHFVSYHNLVASCNGTMLESGSIVDSHCCNNRRGCDYVEPLFLDANGAQSIGYNPDGTLDFNDTAIDATWFNRLNLTADWLRLVRHLWYLVAQSVYTAEQVEEAISNVALRQDIIDDIDRENLITAWVDRAKTPIWTLFAEYNWFYSYYQNK